jgi:hypothetical protein
MCFAMAYRNPEAAFFVVPIIMFLAYQNAVNAIVKLRDMSK